MILNGDTPITRAAWMYSLFFSTSVEPRTVRAYCTQPDSAIARISTPKRELVVRIARQDRPRHAVDQQRHQDRRERQHHVAHTHDEGIEPAADVADSRPSPTPMTTDSATDASPISSEICMP